MDKLKQGIMRQSKFQKVVNQKPQKTYAEREQEFVDTYPIEKVMDKLDQENVKVSNLSVEQYNQVSELLPTTQLQYFPELEQEQRKKLPFLSHKSIQQINRSLGQKVKPVKFLSTQNSRQQTPEKRNNSLHQSADQDKYFSKKFFRPRNVFTNYESVNKTVDNFSNKSRYYSSGMAKSNSASNIFLSQSQQNKKSKSLASLKNSRNVQYNQNELTQSTEEMDENGYMVDKRKYIDLQLAHNKLQLRQIVDKDNSKLQKGINDLNKNQAQINMKLKQMTSSKQYPSQKLLHYYNNTHNFKNHMEFEKYCGEYQKHHKLEMIKFRENVQRKNTIGQLPNEWETFQDEMKRQEEEERQINKQEAELKNKAYLLQQNNLNNLNKDIQVHWYTQPKEYDNIEVTKLEGSSYTSFGDKQAYNEAWKPPIRQNGCICYMENKLYLFGGFGVHDNFHYDSLFCYDLDKTQWSLIKLKGDYPNEPIVGHTMSLNFDQIIVFGGQVHTLEKNLRLKPTLNSIYFINPTQKTIKKISTKHFLIEGRKGHSAYLKGSLLYIFGGINSNGYYLKDCWTFDLERQRWFELKTKYASIDLEKLLVNGGLAYHQTIYIENERSIGVMHHLKKNAKKLALNMQNKMGRQQKLESPSKRSNISQRHSLNINSKFKTEVTHQQPPEFEGLYIFGGQNKDGEVLGKLLLFCKHTNMIREIIASGTTPQPRFGHSMNYIKYNEWFVVHGGRSKEDYFLSDVNIYKVESQEWVQIGVIGDNAIPRVFHNSFLQDTRLIVCGGYNQEGFLQNNISKLELNQGLMDFLKGVDDKQQEKKKMENKQQFYQQQFNLQQNSSQEFQSSHCIDIQEQIYQVESPLRKQLNKLGINKPPAVRFMKTITLEAVNN